MIESFDVKGGSGAYVLEHRKIRVGCGYNTFDNHLEALPVSFLTLNFQ